MGRELEVGGGMKSKRISLLIALMFAILLINEVNIASAASVANNDAAVNQIINGLSVGGAGFGTTLQTQLSNLSKGLLESAKIIAIIMTAIAGCMVCFGIQDGKKTMWNWILGIGLAINFGDLLLNLWSVEYVPASTKIDDYKLLMKSEDDPSIDILSPFMRYYISVIMQGAAVIAPYAVNLTLILAMIDGALKVALDLINGDKIKYLVTTVLKVGFFIFLIQSWVGTNSNYQLMPALSSGFETMGYTAGGAEEMVKEYSKANPDSNIEVQSNQIVTNALNFFNIFWENAKQQNLLTILIGLVCVIAAVVILFLTALEMFMVRIEFWTMALLTIPLLPFGVIGHLKFLSEKAIGTMFNLAIKIFVIAFIATLSVNILTGLVENARTMSESSDFMGNISYFLQVLLYSLILFYMTKKIPELVSGLLSGNPSLSGGSMKEMAMSAARGAAEAVSKGGGMAGAVVGGARALSQSAGAMAEWGGKGSIGANTLSLANAVGGKAMSMMGQAATAGTRAAMYRNPAYQGYQNAISLLGNKSNGLLTKDASGNPRAKANSGGVTAQEMFDGLNPNKMSKMNESVKSSQKATESPFSASTAKKQNKTESSVMNSQEKQETPLNKQNSINNGEADNSSGKSLSGTDYKLDDDKNQQSTASKPFAIIVGDNIPESLFKNDNDVTGAENQSQVNNTGTSAGMNNADNLKSDKSESMQEKPKQGESANKTPTSELNASRMLYEPVQGADGKFHAPTMSQQVSEAAKAVKNMPTKMATGVMNAANEVKESIKDFNKKMKS